MLHWRRSSDFPTMSKLSFRARALDANRTMEIIR
jgi:hypothetical protein